MKFKKTNNNKLRVFFKKNKPMVIINKPYIYLNFYVIYLDYHFILQKNYNRYQKLLVQIIMLLFRNIIQKYLIYWIFMII